MNQRYRPHHSFIWLEALKSSLAIFVALIFVGFSSGIGLLTNDSVSSDAALLTDAIGLSGLGNIAPLLVVGVIALILLVLIIGIIVGLRAWEYRHIWYEFDEGEFSFYQGIFKKQRTHIPYQKVQSVNATASLLQRIIGVCTVDIETAGGAHNQSTSIAYVKKDEAERIRQQLFLRKQFMDAHLTPAEAQERALSWNQGAGSPNPANSADDNVLDKLAQLLDDMRGVFAGEQVDTGTTTYSYGLSNAELVLAAVTGNASFSLVFLGVIVGLFSLFSFASDINLVSEEQVGSFVGSAVAGLGFSPYLLLVIALIVFAVLFLLWVASIVVTCITYGGFTARRRGERIEVEHGILTHVFSGMDVARVQSILIKQTLLQRLLGYCSVSYGRIVSLDESSSASQAQAQNQTHLVVHPCIKLKRAHEIIAGLTPEHADAPECDTPVSPKALRRGLIRGVIWQGNGLWTAVILAIAWFGLQGVRSVLSPDEAASLLPLVDTFSALFPFLFALVGLLIVWDIGGVVLWYRRSAFGLNRRYLTLRNAGYSVSTVVIPRNKIQYAYTSTNPLQRLSGVTTIVAVTAAGVNSKKELLRDVSTDDAASMLDWSRPTAPVTVG